MKRKFFGMLLMGAMTLASVSMFTSCKDYDDDINNLQSQIDGITKQNLQAQLTTLQGALTTAQGAADAAKTTADQAVKDAKAAADAAKAAQGTADEASAAAKAAADAAAAAQATADAAAKQATVDALQETINELKAIIDGKVSSADYANDKAAVEAAIKNVEASIVAINENLLTLEDIKTLLADEGFATDAVVKDLSNQIKALEEFKKMVEEEKAALGIDETWKKGIDEAIASLADIKNDIETNKTDIKGLKERMESAEAALMALDELKIGEKLEKLADISASIDVLNIFVKRNLSSIVFRPDTYFGGIEGAYIYSFNVKNEKMKDNWHYFELPDPKVEPQRYIIAQSGIANYHINPSNVDLSRFKVEFYSWLADIKEPVVGNGNEATRAAGKGLITEVFNNTDTLIKKGYFKDGILKVPFKADVAEINKNLANKKGTIFSLQLTKDTLNTDTVVTSDYAIVYPVVAEQLLICDKSFYDEDATTHNDNIDDPTAGGAGTTPDSYHLHRNFSYLAKANVPATHDLYYKESLNISELLETHYLDMGVNITDTADTHRGKASWDQYPGDSNASVDKDKCHSLTSEQLEDLGLYYDVHLVDYVLGSNKTGESVHMQLSKNAKGEFIVTPRNVTADGETIKDVEANASAVGRMPIVCIELKDKNNYNRTVTFAWMKIRISDKVEQKSIPFELGDMYGDCDGAEGEVTWSQIEYHIYNQLLDGMSKKVFDQTYTYDYYATTGWETVVRDGITWRIRERSGNQFELKDNKYQPLASGKFIGKVTEETNDMFNNTTGTWEDGTTHILRWKFTAADVFALYNTLKNGVALNDPKSNLKDNGDDYVNKIDIVTYVRYRYNATGDEPAIYIKLTIPAGKFHFAKGQLGGSKILAYWYNLNSTVNAENADKAKEVRVNVPVPVPDGSTPAWTYDANANVCPWGDNLWIHNDNLLENTEFVKDLHDYFTNGKLSATVKKSGAGQFDDLAKSALVPEFEFTTPSKSLGNATFDAAGDGSWEVVGYSGTKYTLQLNKAKNQILIIKVGGAAITPELLASITKDEDGVQSVIKYHGGGVNASTAKNRKILDPKHPLQDDILNAYGHKELSERETFTAYIQINLVNACAPVVFDDMWFNVRFIRPLELVDPKDDIVKDAPNDWQPFSINKYASVIDWRNYKGDPNDENKGKDANGIFDYKYYGVTLTTKIGDILTDANLGTAERNDNFTKGSQIDINLDAAYKAKLQNISTIPNFLLEQVDGQTFKYKNNSGINGGFHIFVPIYMEYVFGTQKAPQVQYITVGIIKSVDQPQD